MASETHKYKGHRVTLRDAVIGPPSVIAQEPTLIIDDKAVEYRRLPGGDYFLEDYAYDWTDDLVELAKRFIDHRERAEAARLRNRSGDPEGGI